MHNKRPLDMWFSIFRKFFALVLCSAGVALAIISFAPRSTSSPSRGPMLANLRTNLAVSPARGPFAPPRQKPGISGVPVSTNGITFGHPIIAGIGGTGFEESLRIDPTLNANGEHTVYTSAPGSLSADTSWVWRSLDGGKSFKWVVGAAPLTGKVTTCFGGGDSEIGVDSIGRLYFNDLTLANFSTARSDDGGATFTCSNSGVPDTVVDRQWYAIDGDPLNGGSVYLANDEIGPGGVVCGSSAGNNVLVMYRSPVTGLEPTAGIQFGPANHVSGLATCDEAIMGNNEVSPVATTLGQPDGLGGYATLAAPVKHIYVIHDNAALNKILIGRCFPVPFVPSNVPGIPNVNDPSGLNCTDLLVADLGPGQKTGANFPTMAIDKAGNLYAAWEQAPLGPGTNTSGDLVISGDTVLKYSYSTDQGNTWSAPIQIDTSGSPDGILHNNVFAWINAGDDGRVNIVWYGTPAVSELGGLFDLNCGQNSAPPIAGGKNINGPDGVNGLWSVWMVQTTNGHATTPIFTAPVRASAHPVHRGAVQTVIGGQCSWASRALGDYLQLRTGAKGEAHISYADSNNVSGALAGHAMYVRQNGGTGLYAANSPVSIGGLTPYNGVSDPSGDGKYEAAGISSANMPQLDILSSNISKVTTAPCSVGAPCYKVFMQLNDLSLAPTLAQDPNIDLVWSTMWFVPSNTDGTGGRNFHVYAEAFSDGVNPPTLQCFVGENSVQSLGGGGVLTYPGKTQLLPANCQSTLGPNGNITIYVPLSNVTEAGAIDNRLHEVTASTMTLEEPANTHQPDPVFGFGGSYFNLIDVAQGYVFDPILVSAVSRKTHGAAGTFDVDLPVSGTPGVECRTGGTNNDHTIIITFLNALTGVSSASVTQGTGTVNANSGIGPTANQYTVNLTGVTNAQHLVVTLFGVQDVAGNVSASVSVPMDVLLGDVNAAAGVTGSDVNSSKSQVGIDLSTSNFRNDVNVTGFVSGSDVNLIKAQVGTFLP